MTTVVGGSEPVKCSVCGAENPDGKRFCGDCGSPLKPREPLGIKLQKHFGKQTASVIVLISVLLIVIGFGFLGASNNLRDKSTTIWELDVAHSFLDLAWFFGWLGVAGFFIAGLALLLSYPTPTKEKKRV
jgi:predicted nucleic acid-binding Zn ribbon protein